MMKLKSYLFFLILLPTTMLTGRLCAQPYQPSAQNLSNRKQFSADRFGIFIHWGIYASYAQGEWYLQTGKLNKDEYAQAARGFYPIRFNAQEWVKAFKDAGAKYICLTSRHHDGFSMFKTQASPYNIVDGTPFGRDVVGELSKACQQEGMSFHLYYSLLDWIREDYPIGNSGQNTGRKGGSENYDSYLAFMKAQLSELLHNYGPIRALWFDGYWDHPNQDKGFNWRMPELYSYIHSIKPECLIGNNHHQAPIEGEDFQMFERDLPGENKSGFSANQDVSKSLPLEMCETMNGMWGYKVADLNYKSVPELIKLLVTAASKGSNLLLNIGPRPNGELPDLALNRLKGIGSWMKIYGETVYGTEKTELAQQDWGVSTQKGNRLFLHVFSPTLNTVQIPFTAKVKKVRNYRNQSALTFQYNKKGKLLTINLPAHSEETDFVIKVECAN